MSVLVEYMGGIYVEKQFQEVQIFWHKLCCAQEYLILPEVSGYTENKFYKP